MTMTTVSLGELIYQLSLESAPARSGRAKGIIAEIDRRFVAVTSANHDTTMSTETPSTPSGLMNDDIERWETLARKTGISIGLDMSLLRAVALALRAVHRSGIANGMQQVLSKARPQEFWDSEIKRHLDAGHVD